MSAAVDGRTTRMLASLSLAVALVALVLAGYALSLEQERTEELRALSDSVRAAIEADRGHSTGPIHPPPLGLDEGE